VHLVVLLFLEIQTGLEFLAYPWHLQVLCHLQLHVRQGDQQVPWVLGVQQDQERCLLIPWVVQIRWCLPEDQEVQGDRQDLEDLVDLEGLGILDFLVFLWGPCHQACQQVLWDPADLVDQARRFLQVVLLLL